VEFEEHLGDSNRNIEANVITSRLGGDEPALLVSLLGEIPRLVKGNCNVVVDGGGHAEDVMWN
jgi:hypothetical protein